MSQPGGQAIPTSLCEPETGQLVRLAFNCQIGLQQLSPCFDQTSPFMLDAGQNLQLGFEPIHESRLESSDNFVSRMAQVTDKAWAALVKAADNMAQFYDVHQCDTPRYNIGNKV